MIAVHEYLNEEPAMYIKDYIPFHPCKEGDFALFNDLDSSTQTWLSIVDEIIWQNKNQTMLQTLMCLDWN